MSITCYRSALYAFVLLLGFNTNAQDTLRLTLPQAEQQFINRNLILLAENHNIAIAKAQELQASLYNNPTLAFSGNAYNTAEKKFADISNKTGQYTIDVQQLVLLAGKRKKGLQLTATNSLLAENRFFDLLRTLRYALRSSFYEVHYLQNSYAAYQSQIKSLEQLDKSYQALQERGVVSLHDAVRIRSLLYSLKAEKAVLENEIHEVEAELQLLLQVGNTYIIPVMDSNVETTYRVSDMPLKNLIDTAYANRPDLAAARTGNLYAAQDYTLQKALAVPDLTIGGTFDKRGAHVDNASFLNLAINLPFFNRNQGNIKSAKIAIDQSKLLLQHQQSVVENEVQKTYVKALTAERMLQEISPDFTSDLEKLFTSITENFQKRNISLLEFTDFNESYRNNILQINQLRNQRMQALEELQFAIGTTILH